MFHGSGRVGSRGFEKSRIRSGKLMTREIQAMSRVRPLGPESRFLPVRG